MKTETHVGFGSIKYLAEALSQYSALRVLLVTGVKSFSLSGAEEVLMALLHGCEVQQFFEFSVNPNLEDLQSGIERFRMLRHDVVVAVGGGSAIDMAKLINVYAAEGFHRNVASGRPLIAVPTTAGTGSEATQFATLYVDKQKHSISHPALRPDVAIVDPGLTRSLPPVITATSGMDALTQSIESYWSVTSTDESKAYSREAIGLIVPHLRKAVHVPTDKTRLAMARAAHLSGKAINITKTTAPHALSYALTSRFGVPHGQAVGFTLPGFLLFNHEVTEQDAADPRGAAYVKKMLQELCGYLGFNTILQSGAALRELMEEIGLATTFAGLGIDKPRAIEVMVSEVNTERLGNNPRCVTKDQLRELLETM